MKFKNRRNKKKRASKNKSDLFPLPEPEYLYNSKYMLSIKDSLIKNGGLGVFALENIPENTLLGEYIGDKLHKTNPTTSSYCLDLKSKYFIDAYHYPRCVFAMINDSRFNGFPYNCDFRIYEYKADIWTLCEIKEGSELYLNYGNDYWLYR